VDVCSSYFSTTFLKFFFPLLNTIPSPANWALVKDALMSLHWVPSTETPPCSTFLLASINKNLEVFNTVIGDEVNKIFEQKLLLSENDVQFNSNDESEDKKPSSYFGQKNFMEMLDEDINIYNIYLKGGDYQKSLEEKKEKEKIEREKLEKEKMEEEEKKKKEEDGGYFGGEEEDEDNKKDDLKGSINLNQDNEEENKDNNEGNENNENNEDKNKEEDAKEKEKVEENKEETSSEETEEDKNFNDVNFWKPEISPNDDIMSSILTDLE